MQRTRLLVVVPAATALVFTGIAPAAANGDGGHHHDDDAWAEVLDIDNEAELEDDGDKLEVRFEYKCEDDGEDVEADVTAKNDGHYKADDVDLECDGEERWITVTLEKKHGDEFEEGDRVHVTVTITADDEVLDEETEHVRVVDEDNGHDHNHNHHGHH